MNRGWWPVLISGIACFRGRPSWTWRAPLGAASACKFTIEGWHCFRAIAPNLGVAIRLEAHSFAIVAMPPLDGPRLSEVSPLHATLNCGYRHHGCMCRSCVSQLIRRNPFLRQYVASLTGRMLMVAGRDMLIPGRVPSLLATAAHCSDLWRTIQCSLGRGLRRYATQLDLS